MFCHLVQKTLTRIRQRNMDNVSNPRPVIPLGREVVLAYYRVHPIEGHALFSPKQPCTLSLCMGEEFKTTGANKWIHTLKNIHLAELSCPKKHYGRFSHAPRAPLTQLTMFTRHGTLLTSLDRSSSRTGDRYVR